MSGPDATFVDAIARHAANAEKAKRQPVELSFGLKRILYVPDGDNWKAEQERLTGAKPDMLSLATLDGVVEYLKANRDGLNMDMIMVQVESPTVVVVVSNLEGDFLDRKKFVLCDADALTPRVGPKFGEYVDHETFTVWLQSQFQITDGQKALLKYAGNITDESVKTSIDDGVSQSAIVKTGVAARGELAAPNPNTLAPFRTFREIDQPESVFIFRMKRGAEGQKPIMTLFEADGSQWKLKAVQRIREYLTKKVAKEVSVIA